MGSQDRPAPSKGYTGKQQMDMRDPDQFKDIVQMLKHMADRPASRDFAPHIEDVSRLPESHTHTQFPGYESDEDHPLSGMEHVADFIS